MKVPVFWMYAERHPGVAMVITALCAIALAAAVRGHAGIAAGALLLACLVLVVAFTRTLRYRRPARDVDFAAILLRRLT